MNYLISDLKQALKYELNYLALNTALTIPDICGAISSEDGKATGEKYKNWFAKYCGDNYDEFLTGDDVYKLRCAFLHQGKLNHDFSNFEKLLFQIPNAEGNVLHLIGFNNAILINLKTFVEDLIAGYEIWEAEFKDDVNYKRNYENSVKLSLSGFKPYIEGFAIIA